MNNERNELHKTIWSIAEDLRGAVDGWEFKAYVLGAIFYRYISENLTSYINRLQEEAGIHGFDYARMSDAEAEEARAQMVEEKGFFILPSQLFQNVAADPEKDVNLNETLSNVFRSIEASAAGTDSEEQVKGLFSDFIIDSSRIGNSVDVRNKCIAKVLIKVRDMQLSRKYSDNSIDTVGDTYEFLMQMYASNAGKSGGEFFTPQEVSEVLARIASYQNPHIRKVYDPACGSGSLLMKFVKYAGEAAKDIEFYGQEINPTTYNLCRINMFLHNVNYAKFDIQLGNTLTTPLHMEMKFDAIVSNPPYSKAWDGKTNPVLINDKRYSPAGVLAPASKSDLAFTMHMLYHLNETGTCAIVEFPGVLYRGGAEKQIREYLVKNNFVDTVIQLPANLFFGVGIATCIIVLKKNKKDNNILFIDASEQFVKNGNKNKLEQENQDAIVKAYAERKEEQYFTKLVSIDDVLANDANLSVSSYVEKEDKREFIDIEKLNSEINELSLSIIADSLRLDKNYQGDVSMGKIEKMIMELCPEGVERVKLGEVCHFKRGNSISSKEAVAGNVPVISGGIKPSFYHNQSNRNGNSITVAGSGASAGYVNYWEIPIWVADAFTIEPDEKLSRKFTYLYLKNNQEKIFRLQKGAGVPHVHGTDLTGLSIPIPPLHVQQEIVRTLDAFEEYISKLERLIELRQKQYEYYREKLLTFE